MSDQKSDPPPPEGASTEVSETAPGAVWGVPLESFVKGTRTRPSAHDRMVATDEADAERRRDVSAKERALARVPVHQGGAMIYENKLSSDPEQQQTYFALEYVDARGEPFYLNGQALGCLADVQVLPDGHVQFQMVCPKCKAEGVPQGQCQMRVNSANKRFEIDPDTAGSLVMFNDGFGPKAYRSAGVIRETERLRCYQCGWACRVVRNKVRPE